MIWQSLPERTLKSVPVGTGSQEGRERAGSEGGYGILIYTSKSTVVPKGLHIISRAQLCHTMKTKLGSSYDTKGVQCSLKPLVSESSGLRPEVRGSETTLKL